MLYFSNVIRLRKWKVSLFLGLFCFALGLKVVLKTLQITAAQLTDLQRCPACFGLKLCDAIIDDKITLSHKNIYLTLTSLFGTKNVFLGSYLGEKVVLKKLAHNSELESFDRMLCTDRRLVELCPTNNRLKKIPSSIDFYTRIAKEITADSINENTSSLRLCPNTDHIDNLFYNVYANNGKERKQISHAYLWTMIKINPEPLVLQILPAEDGWPVPKYYGACGRLVIEEYIGPTLSNYHREPWLRRAKISSSLLKAAEMFTYRNPQFGFYLTDISPDNIAIDKGDDAKFIDMENIIVVDKKTLNRTSEWNDLGTNNIDFDCQNCLAFSPNDICSHRYSDHNYYAVCQHLLAQNTSSTLIPGGLLHDVPNDILKLYPDLPKLLEQCAMPGIGQTRTAAGDLLRELLDEILLKNI